MYLEIPYKIQYDTKKYDFKSIIEKIMSDDNHDVDLYNLHKIKDYDVLKREEDQSTIWHKKYYDKFFNEVEPLYKELINEIKEMFNYDEIIYQKIPTFRVHLGNGNLAVGEWHKDRAYNHGTTEVNFWLPFTDTNEENSVWMESKEDKGDFKPYKVNYGEILVFDGANLTHGNKENKSDKTRVSIDFRLVSVDKFKPNQEGSINMNVKFDLGGYFNKL